MNELELRPGEIIETLPAPKATGIDALLEQAIAANIDIDKLERLLSLKERHEAGEARRSYHRALAKFQRECPMVIKRKPVNQSAAKGGGLLYKYAPLSDIVSQVQALESDCGFSHSFDQVNHEGGAVDITCTLTHIDGHVGTSTATIPPTRGVNTNSAQDMSIMRTYGMRSAYLGVLGITVADEDMDGRLPEPEPDLTPITKEQAADLRDLYESAGGLHEASLLQYLAGVDLFEELPASQRARCVQAIKAKQRARA